MANSIEDMLEQDHAEAWNVDDTPGATLAGVVEKIDIREGEYGEYPIVTVVKKDGTREALHAFRAGAKQEIEALKVQAGMEFGVKYVGEVPTKSGKMFKKYTVVARWPEGHTPAPVAAPAAATDAPVTVDKLTEMFDADEAF